MDIGTIEGGSRYQTWMDITILGRVRVSLPDMLLLLMVDKKNDI
jgi:hypothetical protein